MLWGGSLASVERVVTGARHARTPVVPSRAVSAPEVSVRRARPALAHAAILAGAVALVYGQTLGAPFQFDDLHCITHNAYVRTADVSIPSGVEGQDTCAPPSRSVGTYTLALNHRLGGLDVTGYHLFNVLVHLLATLLVYALVTLVFRTPAVTGADAAAPPDEPREGSQVALVSALLFAVHPLQTQAVTYVVQRYTSLATAFYLGAVVLYLASRTSSTTGRRWAAYTGALLSTVLAMRTKEIAFTIPFSVALFEGLLFRGPAKGRVARVAPFLLTLPVIPLAMFGAGVATGGAAGADASMRALAGTDDVARWHYLVTQVRAVATYLRLLVLPVGQNLDHDFTLRRSLLVPDVLASLGLAIVLLGAAAWAVVRTRDGRGGPALSRVAALGTFWFFLTLSVESTAVPLPDLLVEHRMYLPSVGFFLAVSSLAFMLRDRLRSSHPGAARAVLPVLLLAVAVLAVAAHQRNELWRDSVSLWEDVARKSPDRARVRLELGRHYATQRRFDEGAREVAAAIRLKPGDAEAWNNLGALRRQQGRADEALSSYRRALELRPGFAEVHHNIGLLLASVGRLEEAAEEFGEALRLKPDSADVHNALGITWARLGRMPDAVREFQEAVRIDPTHAGARANLARATDAVLGR